MIHFEALQDLGARVALYTERRDGNCSPAADEPGQAVAARRAVCEAVDVDPRALVGLHQVHGNTVVVADAGDRGRGAESLDNALADADGLVTREPGVALIILAADCVPVYLIDPETRAIGLLHAGRLGTLANIAAAAVRLMTTEFDVPPERLHALIGPSAGPEAYEVSPQIAAGFALAGLPVRGRHLDLWQANVQQLVTAGVPREQITVAGLCTIQDGRFFSHRAEPSGERNMAVFMA